MSKIIKKKSVASVCFNRRGRETCFYYYHNIGTYVIIIAFAISCILGCDHYNLDWSDHIYINIYIIYTIGNWTRSDSDGERRTGRRPQWDNSEKREKKHDDGGETKKNRYQFLARAVAQILPHIFIFTIPTRLDPSPVYVCVRLWSRFVKHVHECAM